MTVKEIVQTHSEWVQFVGGNEDAVIERADHKGTQARHAMIYVGSPKDVEPALKSSGVFCVCSEKLVEHLNDHFTSGGRALATAKNVKWAMAVINESNFKFTGENTTWSDEKIHPNAFIHPSAELDSTVVVGPNSSIGAGVKIGSGTVIGPNTTVAANSTIGENCHIHAQVYIGHSTEIHNRVEIHPLTSVGSEGFGYADDAKFNHHRVPHLGKCILEDDVHIGSSVCLDRGTYGDSRIGQGTRVDNHCHFAHNHVIGKNCLITAGFIMAGSTTIGDNFVCGGRTSVSGHIDITNNVQCAAMTVVTKPLDKSGAYAGYPIQSHKDHLRAQSLIGKLPEMKKLLGSIKKKLDL